MQLNMVEIVTSRTPGIITVNYTATMTPAPVAIFFGRSIPGQVNSSSLFFLYQR
jgi:hypothetical protein